MGSDCSRVSTRTNIGIWGNGNSATVVHGNGYNISNILQTAVRMTMDIYRSELIFIQFGSFSLVMMSTMLVLQCLLRRSGTEIQSITDKVTYRCDLKLKIALHTYKKHFKQLDKTLKEIEVKLKSNHHTLTSFASPLGFIEDMYTLVEWSPYLLSIVTTKLIDKDYPSLCICVLTLNDTHPRKCNQSWKAITCALSGLNQYIQASPRLCISAVNAGIIPFLASVLSKKSYLNDLDFNPPVMFVFQMASQILHNIVQIDELKYSLEKYNCREILLDVIAHTNDKLLRVVCILTTIPITRNCIHRISLTNIDVSTLFRLYYESLNSKSRKVYGLKEEHILKGFYAIGQFDCF